MTKDLKAGDKVSWKTTRGETHGTVERRVTSPTTIKGYTAKASKDAPQYKVKSDKTGASAVHKPGALHKD